jgi:hypothetical protein
MMIEVEGRRVEWSGVEWSGVEWSGVEWADLLSLAAAPGSFSSPMPT